MATVEEILVPDIGDFAGVEVIEILVQPGDSIQVEQSLLTLESDKATMEIPAPRAGVIKEIKVKELPDLDDEFGKMLAGKYGFGRSKILSLEETLDRIPTLTQDGLRGGVVEQWWEAPAPHRFLGVAWLAESGVAARPVG